MSRIAPLTEQLLSAEHTECRARGRVADFVAKTNFQIIRFKFFN